MNDHKPLTPEEFKNIYSKVTRLCVDLIVQTNEGIVLTLRKLPSWNNLWNLPGGTVLYKEKIEDAIKRKAIDELGVPVEVIRMLGYIEYPSEEKERGFGWSVSIVILCHAKSLDMHPNDDALEIKIFNKLPYNMVIEQKEFIISRNILTERF